MQIITNYGTTRVVAQSWAEATCAIAQLMADEAKTASLSDYRNELPDIDFDQEELSA